jgi:hypothetical protein
MTRIFRYLELSKFGRITWGFDLQCQMALIRVSVPPGDLPDSLAAGGAPLGNTLRPVADWIE